MVTTATNHAIVAGCELIPLGYVSVGGARCHYQRAHCRRCDAWSPVGSTRLESEAWAYDHGTTHWRLEDRP